MIWQTVGAVLEEAERLLTDAGVWTPRDDAETLTAYVLGINRADLSAQTLLDMNTMDRLRRLVARRANRIPLAYITGRAILGGIEVSVGPGVFVPRLHSEPMLTWGLGVVSDVSRPVIVDLCTGSGAIALAVAHNRPDATVYAMDCDPMALYFARCNADQCAAAGDTPIRLYLGDVTDLTMFTELAGTVDLVLANPPYVAEGTTLLPEWEEHHPRQAIYAGDDGLGVICGVVELAAQLLRPGGGVAIEHNVSQAESLLVLLQGHDAFTSVADCTEYRGQTRHTTARKRLGKDDRGA